MTTQVPHSEHDHACLTEGNKESHRPIISENKSPSLNVPTRSLQSDSTDLDLNLLSLGTPVAKSERPGNKFDTQTDGTNALLDVATAPGGGSTTSHVNHDSAIQQPKSEQARDDSYALRQEVQSVLRRTFELERRMGIVRSDRSVRRERIQLGLEIVVADNRVRARGLPFLIIIFAIIAIMMVSNAYKYAFST